jgi:hypothetical protein
MEFLTICGFTHGGKSFLLDNFDNNGLTFRNFSKLYPYTKTGNSECRSLVDDLDILGLLFFRENKEDFYYMSEVYNGKKLSSDEIKIIFVIRDLRTIWLLNGHFGLMDKENTREFYSFCEETNRYFTFYKKYLADNKNALVIKIEDYFNNFNKTHDEIINFLELPKDKIIYKRSSITANPYLSHIDCRENYNFLKYFDKDEVLDEKFKLLENMYSDYFKLFDYEKHLTLKELLVNIDFSIIKGWRKIAKKL